MKKKVHTWYYNRKDVPRQSAACPLDKGWFAIVGRTLEEAIQLLPASDRNRVLKRTKQYFKEDAKSSRLQGLRLRKPGYATIEDMLGETAGEQNGFSLLNEACWKMELESSVLDFLEDDDSSA